MADPPNATRAETQARRPAWCPATGGSRRKLRRDAVRPHSKAHASPVATFIDQLRSVTKIRREDFTIRRCKDDELGGVVV